MTQENDQFSPEESTRRRNEVLRRMLNTPPQQHAISPPQTSRSRKKAGEASDAPAPVKRGRKKA